MSLSAWIVTIGNEIINGVITDTNRETISHELRALGIPVKGMTSVGDDSAMKESPLVIVSGGLGPTEDDKTAAAVAEFLGMTLERDDAQLERIRERFRTWNRVMSSGNEKQAFFPAGSTPLNNDHGTAPGFMIRRNASMAFFFPGVPAELVGIFREQAAPLILEHFRNDRSHFAVSTMHVYGIAESKLGEILADLSLDEDDYHLAFLPRFPMIRLRVDVKSATPEEAARSLLSRCGPIRKRIRENIISEDGKSMEEVVLSLLQEQNLTLTLAESCTGGMVGEMLTRVPGSSSTLRGSIVSYSNLFKIKILGVKENTLATKGAVSHECAQEMAIGALRVGDSDIGLSITGIAGPDGGSAEKPVGAFFIGFATKNGVTSRGYFLPGSRQWVRIFAAMQSLDFVRRHYLSYPIHGTEMGER